MIFLWGLPGDGPIAAVRDALVRRALPVFFFDQRDVLKAQIELDVGGDVAGALRLGDRSLDLAAVTAAYIRPHDARRVPEVRRAGPESAALRHAAAIDDVLLSWVEISPAFVVNRPSDMGPNGSKPYQAALIEAHGFRTPDTLITTSPEDARAFQARHGSVIYKSISGVRSIVSRLGPEHGERLSNLRWCPTQFQERIPGEDFRVHVVGDRVFTSRISTTVDDYRYARRLQGKTEVGAAEAPPEVAERCARMAHAMRLPVAGIDLRRTPDGEWYCFEVNPSPAFTFYQDACGYAIDDAVAALLAGGRSPAD